MSPIKSFFLGIIAALGALFLEFSFSLFFPVGAQALFFSQFSIFLIISAACEEVIKYAMIYKIFSAVEERITIITGSFLIGLGFSATEIFLNYYSKINLANIPFYFILGMIFIHIFTSVFAGIVVSKKQNPYFTAVRVLILNSAIHIAYNLAVIYLL